MASAARYANARGGIESFAVIDPESRMHAFRPALVAPSASLMKAMLLVAYLNQPSVRARALTAREHSLLAPMIRWSDNETAIGVYALVGRVGLRSVGRAARMRRLATDGALFDTGITAADQARFFARIDRLTPARHRAYALRLLASVVRSQRWGIPPVVPDGWRIFFKGGWGLGTGRVTSQVALVERGERRVSLAILTRRNPDHAYGTETIRGIAARLVRGLR